MSHLSTRRVKHMGFLLATLVVAVLLLRLVSSAQGTPRVHYRVLDARTADSASFEAELNKQAGTWYSSISAMSRHRHRTAVRLDC